MTEHPSPEQLRRWVNQELDVDEKNAIQLHVANCPDVCAPLVDALLGKTPHEPILPDPEAAEIALVPCPGKYKLLARLGKGGMAVVYQAMDLELDRIVAFKVIKPGPVRDDEQWLERFRLEGRAMARLSHPNIAVIHEVGEVQYVPYMVIEFAAGMSLDSHLKSEPIRDPIQIARLVELLARAVHFAHEHGLIHRDLKPSNVLLMASASGIESTSSDIQMHGRTWTPKVSDFGLVKFVDDSPELTNPDQKIGSPSYMAPEQARGDADAISIRTDVYGLGAILYCIAVGDAPFVGNSKEEVIKKVISDEPPSLRRSRPELPPDLETICLKCLAKSSTDRYESAAALADDLRRFLHGEPIAARPVGTFERSVKWIRRRPAAAALTLLGSILFLLIIVLVVAGRYNTELARLNSGLQEANSRLDGALAQTENERAKAESARNEANQQRRIAEQQRSERYRYQYLSSVALLDQYWRDGRHFDMPAVLDAIIPPPEEQDPRGFEWYYWKKMTAGLRSLKAHDDPIVALAIAPDGDTIATASRDRSIRIWGPRGDTPIRTLEKHKLPLSDIAFSPDGRYLASVATDPTQGNLGCELKVWDVQTGDEVLARSDRRMAMFAVTFDPTSSTVVAAGMKTQMLLGIRGVAEVWDFHTGKKQRTIVDPSMIKQQIMCLRFNADGSRAIIGTSPNNTDPGELLLFDTSNWKFVRRIGKHKRGIWNVAFLSDEQRVVASGIDSTVHIWGVASGKEIVKLDAHNHAVPRLAVNGAEQLLATGGFDGTVILWNLVNGRQVMSLKAHAGFIYGVGFTKNGKHLITAGRDGFVHFWDATLGKACDVVLPEQKKSDAVRVTFSPDGRLLAWSRGSLAGPGEIGVWDVADQRLIFSHQETDWAYAGIAFDPTGTELAVGTGKSQHLAGHVEFWNVAEGTKSRTLDTRAGLMRQLIYMPGGEHLVTAGAAGSVMTWDLTTGQPDSLPGQHLQEIRALALSPNGRLLVSGSGTPSTGGGELRIWNMTDRTDIDTFESSNRMIGDLAFSPDGSFLAVANMDESIRIWDVVQRLLVHELKLPRMALAVAYSPDGRRLAAGGYDGVITLWDAKTGYRLLSLNAVNAGAVDSLAFSPDGLQLAVASNQGDMKIIDVSDRRAKDVSIP